MDYAIDNSDTFLKEELLPVIPVKLYFNESGELSRLDNIGADGDLNGFLTTLRP